MGIAEWGGRSAQVAPPGPRLGGSPCYVRLREGCRTRRHRGADRLPDRRIVLAGGPSELGRADGHPPAELADRKLVPLRQPFHGGSIAVDHRACVVHGGLGRGRVARGAGPDRDVRGGMHRGYHQLSEQDRIVHLEQPVQAVPSDLERGCGVPAPEGDLRPDHAQLDGVLSVLNVARLVAGELEMAARGRKVPCLQEQVGVRAVEVDRADARQDVMDVLLEEESGLRVASQLDEHQSRVRLQEPSEPELATVSSRALGACQGGFERFLHEAAHLEQAAEVRVRARELDGVVDDQGDRQRLPQEIDACRDAAEVRPVDPEDVQCPAFDDLGPDRPCALDGALGERDRFGASAGEHQVAGQAHEGACFVGRRRRPVEQVDGLLEQTE